MATEMKLRNTRGSIQLGDSSKKGDSAAVLQAIETLKANAAIEAAEQRKQRELLRQNKQHQSKGNDLKTKEKIINSSTSNSVIRMFSMYKILLTQL